MTMLKQQLTQIVINEININQRQLEIARIIDLDHSALPTIDSQYRTNEKNKLF